MTGTLEFQVDNSALEVIKNTQLSANFDEMKAGLTELVAPYKSVIVTEDAISESKSDRAKLRKVKTGIDDYRKLVKKTYEEPLKAFESKCKELTAICDEGINNLDSQVKAFETKVREEKLARAHGYFILKAVPKLGEFADYRFVDTSKWGNVGTSEQQIQNEIDEYITSVSSDIETLKALDSEFELSLLESYKKNHDIRECFLLNRNLLEAKRVEEERKRAEEERRLQAELAKQKEAEAQKAVEEKQKYEYTDADFTTYPDDLDINDISTEDLAQAIAHAQSDPPAYVTVQILKSEVNDFLSWCQQSEIKVTKVEY